MHAPVHTIQVKIVLFWFVGAMIPVWLSYPLIGAVTRFITRKLRASRNHTARSIAPYGPLIVYFILCQSLRGIVDVVVTLTLQHAYFTLSSCKSIIH